MSFVEFSELNNHEIDKIGTCFPNVEYLNIGKTVYIQLFADSSQAFLTLSSKNWNICAAIKSFSVEPG